MGCRKIESPSNSDKCIFCNTSEVNVNKYGALYSIEDITTHYFCLLLSSNMEQNGADEEGILGFLPDDIRKEIKRGKRLYCCYCKGVGATLGCVASKCRKTFHLPCGLVHGSLHQFFGEFKSFCSSHKPIQAISPQILATAAKDIAVCAICYENVLPNPKVINTLWAPCCKKNAWFHRECVQKLANSAGYFFKCPLCNNKENFQEAMKQFGIFIPEQDASWECVPNAFHELLHRHNRCDAEKCSCPKGRTYSKVGVRWELVLCKLCGSHGTHIFCGRLKMTCPEWECHECRTMLASAATSRISTSASTGQPENSSYPMNRVQAPSTGGSRVMRKTPRMEVADVANPSQLTQSFRHSSSPGSEISTFLGFSPHRPTPLLPAPCSSLSLSKPPSPTSSLPISLSSSNPSRSPSPYPPLPDPQPVNISSRSSSNHSSESSAPIVVSDNAPPPSIITLDSDDDCEIIEEEEGLSNVLVTNAGAKIHVVRVENSAEKVRGEYTAKGGVRVKNRNSPVQESPSVVNSIPKEKVVIVSLNVQPTSDSKRRKTEEDNRLGSNMSSTNQEDVARSTACLFQTNASSENSQLTDLRQSYVNYSPTVKYVSIASQPVMQVPTNNSLQQLHYTSPNQGVTSWTYQPTSEAPKYAVSPDVRTNQVFNLPDYTKSGTICQSRLSSNSISSPQCVRPKAETIVFNLPESTTIQQRVKPSNVSNAELPKIDYGQQLVSGKNIRRTGRIHVSPNPVLRRKRKYTRAALPNSSTEAQPKPRYHPAELINPRVLLTPLKYNVLHDGTIQVVSGRSKRKRNYKRQLFGEIEPPSMKTDFKTQLKLDQFCIKLGSGLLGSAVSTEGIVRKCKKQKHDKKLYSNVKKLCKTNCNQTVKEEKGTSLHNNCLKKVKPIVLPKTLLVGNSKKSPTNKSKKTSFVTMHSQWQTSPKSYRDLHKSKIHVSSNKSVAKRNRSQQNKQIEHVSKKRVVVAKRNRSQRNKQMEHVSKTGVVAKGNRSQQNKQTERVAKTSVVVAENIKPNIKHTQKNKNTSRPRRKSTPKGKKHLNPKLVNKISIEIGSNENACEIKHTSSKTKLPESLIVYNTTKPKLKNAQKPNAKIKRRHCRSLSSKSVVNKVLKTISSEKSGEGLKKKSEVNREIKDAISKLEGSESLILIVGNTNDELNVPNDQPMMQDPSNVDQCQPNLKLGHTVNTGICDFKVKPLKSLDNRLFRSKCKQNNSDLVPILNGLQCNRDEKNHLELKNELHEKLQSMNETAKTPLLHLEPIEKTMFEIKSTSLRKSENINRATETHFTNIEQIENVVFKSCFKNSNQDEKNILISTHFQSPVRVKSNDLADLECISPNEISTLHGTEPDFDQLTRSTIMSKSVTEGKDCLQARSIDCEDIPSVLYSSSPAKLKVSSSIFTRSRVLVAGFVSKKRVPLSSNNEVNISSENNSQLNFKSLQNVKDNYVKKSVHPSLPKELKRQKISNKCMTSPSKKKIKRKYIINKKKNFVELHHNHLLDEYFFRITKGVNEHLSEKNERASCKEMDKQTLSESLPQISEVSCI